MARTNQAYRMSDSKAPLGTPGQPPSRPDLFAVPTERGKAPPRLEDSVRILSTVKAPPGTTGATGTRLRWLAAATSVCVLGLAAWYASRSASAPQANGTRIAVAGMASHGAPSTAAPASEAGSQSLSTVVAVSPLDLAAPAAPPVEVAPQPVASPVAKPLAHAQSHRKTPARMTKAQRQEATRLANAKRREETRVARSATSAPKVAAKGSSTAEAQQRDLENDADAHVIEALLPYARRTPRSSSGTRVASSTSSTGTARQDTECAGLVGAAAVSCKAHLCAGRRGTEPACPPLSNGVR